MKLGEIWGYVTDRFYTENDFNADGTLKQGIPIPHGVGKVYPGDVLYKTPQRYTVEPEQQTIRVTNELLAILLHVTITVSLPE